MRGIVAGKDYLEGFEAMKYWSFPSSYNHEKRAFELNQMLYSGNYMASEKKDGYFERIVKDEDGNIFMCSRNLGVGGLVEKSAWVPHLHPFFEALPNGTVIIGEVYLENGTSKNITSILGCLVDKAIARQKKDEDKLRFYVFDILAYNNKECHQLPMYQRVTALRKMEQQYKFPFVSYAEYWATPDDIHENWLSILAAGGEGVVLVQKELPYEFGKRGARKTLKLKKELDETIDVFLTGRWKEATKLYNGKERETWQYWQNMHTGEKHLGTYDLLNNYYDYEAVTKPHFYGWAGAIEIAVVRNNTLVTPIGWVSGITDEVRKGIVENNEFYRGKVIELQAMEIDRSNPNCPSLRHARIIRWRDDKAAKDCKWEQLT